MLVTVFFKRGTRDIHHFEDDFCACRYADLMRLRCDVEVVLIERDVKHYIDALFISRETLHPI